jgi:hypothetical protein
MGGQVLRGMTHPQHASAIDFLVCTYECVFQGKYLYATFFWKIKVKKGNIIHYEQLFIESSVNLGHIQL